MSLINSLNKTNLDIENSNPLGGPNRTNSANIPSGFYFNTKATNINSSNTPINAQLQINPNAPTPSPPTSLPIGGLPNEVQLNRYLPNIKYENTIDPLNC